MSLDSFVNWLQSQNKRHWTIKYIKNYAVKYGHILDSGDASPLAALTPCNRQHAMTALANLAKFTGRYDLWLQIRQRYNLKWSSGNNSLQSLQRFFNPSMSLDSMISKVREMIRVLNTPYGLLIRFACLTGLRPSEACESVRLLNDRARSSTYYNPEQQCLEHFRFPDIFLRKTKNAYISYLSRDNFNSMTQKSSSTSTTTTTTPTWNSIRLACRRRGINMDMRLCRKIFASWLIKSGIDSNTTDILQGRCPSSVLVRHYQSPSSDLKDKVLSALASLQKQIE